MEAGPQEQTNSRSPLALPNQRQSSALQGMGGSLVRFRPKWKESSRDIKMSEGPRQGAGVWPDQPKAGQGRRWQPWPHQGLGRGSSGALHPDGRSQMSAAQLSGSHEPLPSCLSWLEGWDSGAFWGCRRWRPAGSKTTCVFSAGDWQEVSAK